MHDKYGVSLTKGDHVTVEFVITDLHPQSDRYNVNLETVDVMPGTDWKTTLSAINTLMTGKVGS